MLITFHKTMEIVLHRPHPSRWFSTQSNRRYCKENALGEFQSSRVMYRPSVLRYVTCLHVQQAS